MLEIMPGAKAWITLSTLEALAGDWRSAEACVRQALALEESPEGWWNLAAILEKRGQGKEARRIRARVPFAMTPSGMVDVRSLSSSVGARAR